MREKVKEDVVKHKTEKEKRFDAIYHRYADDVYRACLYLTKDTKAAQELAKRTFLEFYDCFEDLNPDMWYAYLIRIARTIK